MLPDEAPKGLLCTRFKSDMLAVLFCTQALDPQLHHALGLQAQPRKYLLLYSLPNLIRPILNHFSAIPRRLAAHYCPKYTFKVKRVGLKLIKIAGTTATKMPAIGQRNTCTC